MVSFPYFKNEFCHTTYKINLNFNANFILALHFPRFRYTEILKIEFYRFIRGDGGEAKIQAHIEDCIKYRMNIGNPF